MKKAIFKYTKDDGSISNREILSPKFLKESSNNLKQFDKEDVKYIRGYEINKEGLNEEEILKYEETLENYCTLTIQTIQDYFKEAGLDSTKVSEKAFKKQNVSEISIVENKLIK